MGAGSRQALERRTGQRRAVSPRRCRFSTAGQVPLRHRNTRSQHRPAQHRLGFQRDRGPAGVAHVPGRHAPPMFVVHRRDVELNGRNHLRLSRDPALSPESRALGGPRAPLQPACDAVMEMTFLAQQLGVEVEVQ